MCKERWRTRDLLLEYDKAIIPPRPRAAGLGIVYPWENITISNLSKQLFTIVSNSGYIGTEEDFNNQFGAYLHDALTIFNTIEDFPETGELNKLYFDTEEKILYYWDNGYYPINALLIENSILNSGTSVE